MSPEQLADGARQSVESPKYGSVTLNRSQVKDCKSFKVVSTGVTTLPAVARRGSDRGHGFVPTWPRRGTHCAFEDRSFAHPTAHARRDAGLAAIVAIHHFLQPTTRVWGSGNESQAANSATDGRIRQGASIRGSRKPEAVWQETHPLLFSDSARPTQILFSDFLEVQQKIGSSGRTRTYNPPVNSRTYVLAFFYSQQPTCNQRKKRRTVTEPLSNRSKVLHLVEGERV